MTDVFSPADYETLQQILSSFHSFLNHIKFRGDWKVALGIERSIDRTDIVVPATHIDCVHAWIAWQLSFKTDTCPLWLVRDWRQKSPVMDLVAIIARLGKFAPDIDYQGLQTLSIRQYQNRLGVSSIHPHAGCGASLTHLIIEDCPHGSDEWTEMVNALSPVLYSVTKGRGPIITVSPA